MAQREGNSLISDQSLGYKSGKGPMAQLEKTSGMYGALPSYAAWNSNMPATKQPLQTSVLKTPIAFDYMPGGGKPWHEGLKALIEVHSREITGIDSSLSVEYIDTQFGNNASDQFSEVGKVNQATSAPSHVIPDKLGKPAAKIINGWILNLLGDPQLGYARIFTYGDNANRIPDLLPDMVSMTVLYYEPDPTMRYVQNAWLIGNMRPRAGSVEQGSRVAAAPRELIEHTIEFTAWQQVGEHVNQLAQDKLDEINSHRQNFNPAYRPAMTDGALPGDHANGFIEEIKKASETFRSPNTSS